MADNAPRVTRAGFEKAVVDLAQKDESFREKLIANPRQALKDGGFELPAGVELKVVQEQPGTFYLVLPAKAAEGELADQELANVAGGLGTLATQTATLAPQTTLSNSLLSSATLQTQTAASAAAKMPDPNLSGIRVSWG